MKLSAVAQKNKGISLAGERVVVIGGTQGIGEAVGCRFAEAGAEVWIAGRNEAKANAVLEKLRARSAEAKIDPAPEHAFLRADLSLVAEALRLADHLRTRAGLHGIDYLVMTQGGPSNGKFVPTQEGYDQHYGVQVLSRFIIAHQLAGDPVSSIVKRAVMSIMLPAKSFTNEFDVDDIDLFKAKDKGTYGFFNSTSRDSIVVDSFTQEIAKQNPSVNFTHVFPGLVKTNVVRNSDLPWHISLLSSAVLMIVATTPRRYAEVPFYLLAHPDGRALAGKEMYTNEKLAKLDPSATVKDGDIRNKIYTHLLDIVASRQ